MTYAVGDLVMHRTAGVKALVFHVEGPTVGCVWTQDDRPRWLRTHARMLVPVKQAPQRLDEDAQRLVDLVQKLKSGGVAHSAIAHALNLDHSTLTKVLVGRRGTSPGWAKRALDVLSKIPRPAPARADQAKPSADPATPTSNVVAELKAELEELYKARELGRAQAGEVKARIMKLRAENAALKERLEREQRAATELLAEAERAASKERLHEVRDAARVINQVDEKRVAAEKRCAELAAELGRASAHSQAYLARAKELATELGDAKAELERARKSSDESKAWQQRAVEAEKELAARKHAEHEQRKLQAKGGEVPHRERGLLARAQTAEAAARSLQNEVLALKKRLQAKQEKLDEGERQLNTSRERLERLDRELAKLKQQTQVRAEKCPSCGSTRFVPVSGGYHCIDCNHRWPREVQEATS